MTTDTAITVRGYTTCGGVRGQCGHLHRSEAAAQACADRDQAGCASQRGYSDRSVCVVGSDGCLYRDESCADWLPAAGGRGSGAMRFSR